MCKRFYLKKTRKNRNYGTSLHSQLWCCMNTQEFYRAKNTKNFKTYVICDLNIEKNMNTYKKKNEKYTQTLKKIPFKVTLMRCVSYKYRW